MAGHPYTEGNEPPLTRIEFHVCELCLTGAGGECHVPGCTFWLNDAPIGSALAWLRERTGRPMTDHTEVISTAAWQFNEAVSLLREARQYVPECTGCAEDIDDGLSAIDDALRKLAAVAKTRADDLNIPRGAVR